MLLYKGYLKLECRPALLVPLGSTSPPWAPLPAPLDVPLDTTAQEGLLAAPLVQSDRSRLRETLPVALRAQLGRTRI